MADSSCKDYLTDWTWQEGKTTTKKQKQNKDIKRRGLRALNLGDYMQTSTVCSDNWMKVSKSHEAGISKVRLCSF